MTPGIRPLQSSRTGRITTILLFGKSPWNTIFFHSHFRSHFFVDLYDDLTVVCRILILQPFYILPVVCRILILQSFYSHSTYYSLSAIHVLHTIPYYYMYMERTALHVEYRRIQGFKSMPETTHTNFSVFIQIPRKSLYKHRPLH